MRITIVTLHNIKINTRGGRFYTIVTRSGQIANRIGIGRPNGNSSMFTRRVHLHFANQRGGLIVANFRNTRRHLTKGVGHHTGLTKFRSVTSTILGPYTVPIRLVFRELLGRGLLRLFSNLIARGVLFQFTAPTFITIDSIQVGIYLITNLAMAISPYRSFGLTSRRIGFLRIATNFLQFSSRLNRPHFRARFSATSKNGTIPTITLFPTLRHQTFRLRRNNGLQRKGSLPMRRHHLAAQIIWGDNIYNSNRRCLTIVGAQRNC